MLTALLANYNAVAVLDEVAQATAAAELSLSLQQHVLKEQQANQPHTKQTPHLEYVSRVTLSRAEDKEVAAEHAHYTVELFRRGTLLTAVQRSYVDFDRLRQELFELPPSPSKHAGTGQVTADGRNTFSATRLLHFPKKPRDYIQDPSAPFVNCESQLQQWLNAALCLHRRPGQTEKHILPWFGL